MQTPTESNQLVAALIDEGCGSTPFMPVVTSLFALWQQCPLLDCLDTIEHLKRHANEQRRDGMAEDAEALESIAELLTGLLMEPRPPPCAKA